MDSGSCRTSIETGPKASTKTSTPITIQTFETPIFHELVGGDRNMEQHNLIVTPDGKTWDQLTRKTDYIGKGVVALRSDGGQVNFGDTVILDDCRGWKTDPGNAIHLYNKDFAIAYDRIICLKDGAYQINASSLFQSAGSQQAMYIKVNGNLIFQIYTEDATWDSGSSSVEAHLNHGDYVQVFGGYWTEDEAFSRFTITRI